MENIQKINPWPNRIFYGLLIILILASVGVTFWRIVIKMDYQIVAEVSCDPAVESCYHYQPEECDMSDYDCLSQPPEEAYDYKLISKTAATIYACEQTEEKLGCSEELSCLDGELNCEYTYCDAETEECAVPTAPEAVPEPVTEDISTSTPEVIE
jgi:hypothetical protein